MLQEEKSTASVCHRRDCQSSRLTDVTVIGDPCGQLSHFQFRLYKVWMESTLPEGRTVGNNLLVMLRNVRNPVGHYLW